MNAPLSRYLTRFADEDIVAAPPPPVVVEPMVTMTATELDARLEEVRDAAIAEVMDVQAAEWAELERAYAAVATEAVATARAEWCAGVADEIAGIVERGLVALQADLTEATAKALRPLLTEAARERALTALTAAVGRLITDRAHPAIAVRAPADLIEALRTRGLPDGIALVAAETTEVVVTCGGSRIETRLAAALADIDGATA